MDRRPLWWGAIVLATLGLSACSGDIEGSGVRGSKASPRPPGDRTPTTTPGTGGDQGVGPPPKGSDDPPPPGADPMAMNLPGVAPLRRLSIREYNNTVRDLLGLAALPGVDFATDDDAGGFSIGGPVTTSTDAARFLDAADQIATLAKIETLLPCGAALPADRAAQDG